MIKSIKNFCLKAFAPTVVVTLIFFVNYYFFGMENTMIGPFVTLSFLRFRNMSNHYSCMCKTYLIYLIMTALAFIAVINIPLCILVNACALFWLAYCLIDEYNPTNYFPAGMALIFFQIAPVKTPQLLLTRIEGLTVSFLIIFIFLIILAKPKAARNSLYSYIQKGLKNCSEQLKAFEIHDTTKLEFLHQELSNINKQICDEIYNYNRASLRLIGKINWYCRYVALFQVINFSTREVFNREKFADISGMLKCFTTQFEKQTPSADYKRLHFRNRIPSIRAFRFRFALRLVIVITPCLAFAYISQWENSYWLVISVFFMMIPVYENTKLRIRQRVIGTLIGIIVCFFLFSIIRQFPGRAALMTFANFMIYGSSNYSFMVIYITCSALAIQSLESTISILLLERLIYTGVGGAIALFANKFIFPIRTRKDMAILIERLNALRSDLTQINEESYPDPDERQYHTDELIIKSYMLMKRLQTYHASLPAGQQSSTFIQYEEKYMHFMGSYLREHLIDKITFH